MPAGCSGTPLARKLGMRDGHTVVTLDEPDGFLDLFDDLPDVELRRGLDGDGELGPGPDGDGGVDLVLLFVTERAELARQLPTAGDAVFPDGGVWVAWPKKASKVPTDVTEDIVREVALPLGLVDTKVCAISDVWSGLRVVWRRERRGQPRTTSA